MEISCVQILNIDFSRICEIFMVLDAGDYIFCILCFFRQFKPAKRRLFQPSFPHICNNGDSCAIWFNKAEYYAFKFGLQV
uniref:Uncharacterized protein n=1 Tax=Gossypium raimondii TaxID=29730 RepID=A0A0D2UC36_GOSRA|nr:hypothetical protein B456_010G102700 [Gossypium raimondii]